MAILTEIIIVISIFLILLSQTASFRVRHSEGYLIDIDTPFLGVSIKTGKKKTRKREKERKHRKHSTPAMAYYYALSYLVSSSRVAIGKLSPTAANGDSPLSLLPTYTVIYSILSLVVNTAEKATLAKDFSDCRVGEPNIDLTLQFSLIHLIISLILIQYYAWRLKREVK